MIKKGRKSKQWEATRKRLKVQFFAQGLTVCEICGSDFALSFSHRFKRKDIKTQQELETVILVCAVHHEFLENHPNKFNLHNEIISKREVYL